MLNDAHISNAMTAQREQKALSKFYFQAFFTPPLFFYGMLHLNEWMCVVNL